MPGKYILNANGEPQLCEDIRAWGHWFQAADEQRRVGDDTVGDVRVSTVFLGADHNFTGKGQPVLWESMVFGGALDGEQDRYTSRTDAEAGHAALLAKVREASGA